MKNNHLRVLDVKKILGTLFMLCAFLAVAEDAFAQQGARLFEPVDQAAALRQQRARAASAPTQIDAVGSKFVKAEPNALYSNVIAIELPNIGVVSLVRKPSPVGLGELWIGEDSTGRVRANFHFRNETLFGQIRVMGEESYLFDKVEGNLYRFGKMKPAENFKDTVIELPPARPAASSPNGAVLRGQVSIVTQN